MSTKKKNAAFDRLTKPQRAVAVAKDALRMLDSKYLKASHAYVAGGPRAVKVGTCNLQSAMKSDPTPCKVCGIGALFVGKISKFNQVELFIDRWSADRKTKLLSGYGRYEIHEELGKVFTNRQLYLVETAYESFDASYSENKYTNRESGGIEAYRNIYSDSERLRRILQNIVRKKGVFRCSAEQAAIIEKPRAVKSK